MERKRLPTTRNSVTHKFQIGGCEGYIIAGLYDDGTPGEIFFRAGNSLHDKFPGMEPVLECWCLAVSILLQHGMWELVHQKFSFQRFEPSDFKANSIIDYIMRWIKKEFYPDA